MKKFTESKTNDLKKKWKEPEQTPEDVLKAGLKTREVFNTWRDYFHANVFPEYVKGYKNKFLYTGDRFALLQKLGQADRSNKKYPLITSIHDTYFSNTYDVDTRVRAFAQTQEDISKAKAAQSYIEWWFSTDGVSRAQKQMDYESILIGPGYGRAWFMKRDEKFTYLSDWWEYTEKLSICRPDLSYLDVFSVYFNPLAPTFSQAPKFIRTITTLDEVRTRFKHIVDITDEQWIIMQDRPETFDDNDYRKIKRIKAIEETIMKDVCNINVWVNNDLSFTDTWIYNVDFKTGLCEVVEYYEYDRMQLFINGYIVYDWPSIYPFYGDPVVRTEFINIPGTLFPIWVSQKLETIQSAVDVFLNSWIDGINKMTNPPLVYDKWFFSVWGFHKGTTAKLKNGELIERIGGKTITPFYTIDSNAVNSLLQWLQYFTSQAYESVGLNSYTQWWAGKVERTSGGVSARTQILKTALIPFFNNKNETLTNIADRWISMGRVFLPNDTMVRVLGQDKSIDFTKINLSEMVNKFDFSYDNQSIKSIVQREERDDIIAALQYVQDPETRKMLEKKLLETYDIVEPSFEQKKKRVDEATELELYKQQKIQAAQPPQPQPNMQWSQPEMQMPQQPMQQPQPSMVNPMEQTQPEIQEVPQVSEEPVEPPVEML